MDRNKERRWIGCWQSQRRSMELVEFWRCQCRPKVSTRVIRELINCVLTGAPERLQQGADLSKLTANALEVPRKTLGEEPIRNVRASVSRSPLPLEPACTNLHPLQLPEKSIKHSNINAWPGRLRIRPLKEATEHHDERPLS